MLSALVLAGCVTREQQDIGSVSITDSKFSFNVELVYDEKKLGQCVVSNAQPGSGPKNYAISLEHNSSEVVCTKKGTRVARRVITPRQWHSKIHRQRKTAIVGALVGGGIIAGAAAAIGGRAEKPIEKIPKHQRIYAPFVAIVPDRSSKKARAALSQQLNAKYETYLAALPKDCQNWNRREMTALCDPAQIDGVRQLELQYIQPS